MPALDVVVDLVRAAAAEGLLDDVGSLTDGLTARGWRRHRRGGEWELEHPVGVSAWTSVTPPTVAVHLDFEDDDASAALAVVLSRIEQVLAVPPQRDASHEPDQFSAWWEDLPGSDLSVSVVLLPSTSTHQSFALDVTPTASLAVELRGDAWAGEEAECDPERARRIVREGTAVERWYLAGQRVLPPDVVTALEDDDDPLVVSAVCGHAHVRAFVAGQGSARRRHSAGLSAGQRRGCTCPVAPRTARWPSPQRCATRGVEVLPVPGAGEGRAGQLPSCSRPRR